MIKHYVDFMTNNITEKKPIPYVNKGRTITLDIEYCSERPYRYLNPTVIKLCNKTELEVIYYIEEHLKQDNYSMTLSSTIIAPFMTAKDPKTIRDAIRGLNYKGIIARWKDMENIPAHVVAPPKLYFINPIYIQHGSWRKYEQLAAATKVAFDNTREPYTLGATDAIRLINSVEDETDII